MIYLPDTNACVALLRGQAPQLTTRWRQAQQADLATCSIVVYELRYGAERSANPAREHAKLDAFLEPYVCLPFDEACARRCGHLRRQLEQAGHGIGPHDLQIASIALNYEATLVTHNAREFGRITGLRTQDWEA